MMNFDTFVKNVTQWATDRNFHTDATLEGQALKGMSELGELCDNLAKGKDIKDDIGDCAVVGVVLNTILNQRSVFSPDVYPCSNHSNPTPELIRKLARYYTLAMADELEGAWAGFEELYALAKANKVDFYECLATAWNDIKDRKGIMYKGVFIKEADPRYKELTNAPK